jgi:hypothetical protein
LTLPPGAAKLSETARGARAKGERDIRSKIEKLVERLASRNPRKREEALVTLAAMPPGEVIRPVADLLVADSDPVIQSACLDVLERLGAAASLADFRADDWFERIGEEVSNFDAICSVLGARFLAYSMMLGIQIRSLTTDPRSVANTSVEFETGDGQPQVLPLGEFRLRVVQALIQQKQERPPAALPLTPETAVALVGRSLILLAPLFGLSLQRLVLAGAAPAAPRALLGFLSDSGFSFMELEEFERFVKQKVRRDLAGALEEPLRLDLGAVEHARAAAAAGDMDGVIGLLENWPGLLVTLQRTPMVHQLEDRQLELISEGLRLLGDAFVTRGRRNWSEELYRLGLQFVREGRPAGRLYQRLGVLLCGEGRFGEAIGLLRRAQGLGVEEEEILPHLGRAFLRRDKLVAAAALLEEAGARGIETPELRADLAEVRERFARADLTWDIPAPATTPGVEARNTRR